MNHSVHIIGRLAVDTVPTSATPLNVMVQDAGDSTVRALSHSSFDTVSVSDISGYSDSSGVSGTADTALHTPDSVRAAHKTDIIDTLPTAVTTDFFVTKDASDSLLKIIGIDGAWNSLHVSDSLDKKSDTGHTHTPIECELTFSDSVTIDASLCDVYYATLDSNIYFKTPSNPIDAKKIIIRLKQDDVGSRAVSFDTSAFRFSTDLPSPTLTTGMSKTDYLGFIYNGAINKWDLIGQVLGF